MIHYKSNQPLYKLHFSELDENAVKVLSFEGEESISRLFEYRFELISKDPELDAKSILNKKATFEITRGEDEPLKIHGIISRFEQRGRTPDYVSYYAVLVPKMWRLNLTYQSEIYQHMDIKQLVATVLEASGLSGEDYELRLSASYPKLEYAVQYRESNFNFLNRRLEHFGIFYYFDHREEKEVVIFVDENEALPAIAQEEDLFYNPNKDQLSGRETIGELSSQERVVTGLVRLKDYNYLHPEKQLLGESQIDSDSPGMYYEYGDHFDDERQGDMLARIRNEELLATSKIFSGKSDCRLFRAGYKFTLAKHYRADWNAEYVLTKIKMRGTQRGLFSILSTSQTVTPTYENMFEAIPAEIAYRPPRRTPIPRMHGIMSAKIESAANDEYAFIDDHGRYRAKMLYDISERKNGEATLPIRQVQSYSGSGYGMHFPNHAGTELVWACVDGNVDRPVGLGTVPNPTNFSPSTSSNKTQSVIRTAGQNELTFDDSSGGENIYLHATKDHTIQIVNDKSQSVGNNEALEVGTNRTKTVGNDEKVAIGNNRDKSVANDETVFVGKNQSESVGANKIEKIGANQTLRVASNQKETIGAHKRSSIGGNFKQAIKGGVIQIIKKQMIRIVQAKVEKVLTNKTVKVGGSYRMQAAETNTTTEGASTETVGEAKELKARTIAVEAGEQIELKSGDGKIVFTKDGKIVITGVDIKFESKTFDLAATEAVKVACTKNINTEAGGQNIIKGVPIKLN